MKLFYKYFLFLVFIFVLHISSNAQIVVIESSQLDDTIPGWNGAINLDLYLTESTTQAFTANFGSSIRYSWKNQSLTSLNNYRAILQLDQEETKSENQAYQHFRYNYDFNKVITGEAFVQGQYDYVLRIDFRGLIGLGPRFNLMPNKKNDFLFGAITMFEYEEERGTDIIHRDIRFSFNLIYNINISDNTNVKLMGYYQPLANYIKDYRVSSSASFTTKITERLAWFINTAVLYDAFPVQSPEIPKLTYNIRNGFSYTFK